MHAKNQHNTWSPKNPHTEPQELRLSPPSINSLQSPEKLRLDPSGSTDDPSVPSAPRPRCHTMGLAGQDRELRMQARAIQGLGRGGGTKLGTWALRGGDEDESVFLTPIMVKSWSKSCYQGILHVWSARACLGFGSVVGRDHYQGLPTGGFWTPFNNRRGYL